ncbi:putative amidoligase domain-containing protein [Gordoniibacillus kamchatkensis]|uniref:putative amidoligase domain-containing protein n=1 Tax=Gordoniibacillus kamchatkensis TaxID=1590651 RepID=UPI000B1999EF|nr:hypothetical protein [Paenibacillus sp. VKM B-2647]
MLGSDPEFLLVSPAGKVVPASRYLERDGEAGCDAIVLRGHRVITPLAELRPRPSPQPRRLAANLHGAMRLAASRIGDASLAWLAGGMPLKGFPLGGHVHFSRVWLNSHLLQALDHYLALPLMLIEADADRRRRPRYGFLGDFRRQPHGGFEYRTLPSWLATPLITVGVFALARVVADGYRSLPSVNPGASALVPAAAAPQAAGAAGVAVGAGAGSGAATRTGTVAECVRAPAARPLDDISLLEAYYSGDKAVVQPVVAGLWRELEQLPGYAEFAAYLDPLRERTLRMEPWRETDDVRRAWKIAPFDGKRATAPEFVL